MSDETRQSQPETAVQGQAGVTSELAGKELDRVSGGLHPAGHISDGSLPAGSSALSPRKVDTLGDFLNREGDRE